MAETGEKAKPAAKAAEGLKSERGEVKVEDQISPEVASPTGPVPVSALVSSEEAGEELREKRREALEAERNHPKASDHLSEEVLEGLSSAELRAVAKQRGYEVKGRRLSAEQFAELQDNDDNIKAPKASGKKK